MAHNASHISLQAHLRQHHEAEPATGSASWVLPRAPTPLVAQKRVAEDLEGRNVKRVKRGSGGIKNDPFFKPVLDQHGQHDGTYVCSKDGTVIRPGSHKRHIETAKHLGFKLGLYTCPLCPEKCVPPLSNKRISLFWWLVIPDVMPAKGIGKTVVES
ncbi:hypothetical protein BDR05DRAFT_315522 [Suillus weaverae]|nr:hypothetical protein BDR05DRAFT_315522 [Suillus weaverae]